MAKAKASNSNKKSSKSKSILIAGAIGIAVVGGAGGYILRATTTPDAAYMVTRYRLNKAKDMLAALTVRNTDVSSLEYNRSVIPSWSDPDKNGCNTRADILLKSLDDLVVGTDPCTVKSGTLYDYYTGQTIAYVTDPSNIDIDHIVATKNAWDSGADRWNTDQWKTFVNDPNVLIAVSSSENRSKGERDAAEWLVPNNPAYQCRYVISQITIKTKYSLSVRQVEKDTMSDVLKNNCTVKR